MTILIPFFKNTLWLIIFSVHHRRQRSVIVGLFGEEKNVAWNKAAMKLIHSCKDVSREFMPRNRFLKLECGVTG